MRISVPRLSRRRLAPHFYGLRGTERPSRIVSGLDTDVRLGGTYRDGGLEALPGRGLPDGSQLVGSGTGERLPSGDLRGAVPAGVDRHLVVGGSGLGRRGGIFVRLPAPWKAEGSVGVDL